MHLKIGAPVDCNLQLSDLQMSYSDFNTLRLRQKGRKFPVDIFKCIFLNENI